MHTIVGGFPAYLPVNAYLLDCGCGTGRPVAKMIVESGGHVHGVDFAPAMVELSRKQVPHWTCKKANMLEYAHTISFNRIIVRLYPFALTREEITTMARKWAKWIAPEGLLLMVQNTVPLHRKCLTKMENMLEACDPDSRMRHIPQRWPPKAVGMSS